MVKWLKFQNKKRRGRRLVLIFIIAIALGGGMSVWWASLPPVAPSGPGHIEYQIGGAMIAHAQPGAQGCATCHAEAISFDTCWECHETADFPGTDFVNFQITPTTMLINFPHHNETSPPGGYVCSVCHSSGSDARYITIPAAGHDGSLCADCHSREHSEDAS